jgi:membrane-associated protein
VVTTTLALGPEWLQPDTIIAWLGPWALVGLAAIIFAECGLLLGFFLPGDSLLFTAGLFAVNDQLPAPLWLVVVILVVAAFAGNVCGYYIGRVSGPAIFDKPKSRLFKPEHVVKTQAFFDKYGNRAIVLGRFVPIVRTFITVMAGVGKMPARQYLTYSLIGGVLWAAGVTLLGAVLGQFVFVRNNIELILILVVLLSLLPIAIELLRARREKKHAAAEEPAGSAPEGAAAATQRLPAAPGPRPAARPPGALFDDATQPIPRHQPHDQHQPHNQPRR